MSDRYLYRAYDAAGTLLYVGQSADPIHRRSTHLTSSEWAGDAREWRITGPFPADQTLALEAEAITAEKPVYNVRCAALPFIPRGSARVAPLDHDPAAVRRALKRAGMQQKELAAASGISPSLMCEILRGTRNATPRVLRHIADVLCVPMSSLESQVAA